MGWYRHNELHHYQLRLEELNNNQRSSLRCFNSFLIDGLSPEEFITLNSIKKSIESFSSNITGSISKYKDGWKDFTEKDAITNESNFSASKFYTPTMHMLEFQKQFSKTQLVTSYFEERRVQTKKEERIASQFIADWVYFRTRSKRRVRHVHVKKQRSKSEVITRVHMNNIINRAFVPTKAFEACTIRNA